MKTSAGPLIRELRKGKGLTLEALADRSGISSKTIQRIENGKTNARGFTLKKLADALDIEIEQLTFATDESFNNKKRDGETGIQELKKLNLSALLILFFPLANLLLPYFFYTKYHDLSLIKDIGSRIISFHILWLVGTSLALIAAPFSLLFFKDAPFTEFGSLIFTYMAFWLVNMISTFWFAVKLNKKDLSMMHKLPKLF